MRFVIGRVDERRAAGRNSVAQAGSGVIQELGANADALDGEIRLPKLYEIESGGKVFEWHREIGVVRLTADRPREAAVDPRRAVDGQVAPGHERRKKERQALDMVGVRVADKEVGADRLAPLSERVPKLSRARAAVEDQEGAIVGPDLDAGGVPAIADGLGTRSGDRATRAPDTDADGLPACRRRNGDLRREVAHHLRGGAIGVEHREWASAVGGVVARRRIRDDEVGLAVEEPRDLVHLDA